MWVIVRRNYLFRAELLVEEIYFNFQQKKATDAGKNTRDFLTKEQR